MTKKVLAVYYSQSGQLEQIIDRFIQPLTAAGATVEKLRIKPVMDYAFPWTSERFYAVMPDCVLGVPVELEPFTLKETAYDLIIFGYQAWFLAPGIPTISILNNPVFKTIVNNTPVITITAARNMWLNAFDGVKKSLTNSGALLAGNIVLVDKHPNIISFVTIFHWLLGGKKTRYLNIFPTPGVADADIANAKTFGVIVLPYLNANNWAGMQDELMKHKAVELKYPLMLLETKAVPTYKVWADFIMKRQKKAGWLLAFKYYLLFALFIASPVILVIDAVFIKPFSARRIRAMKQYYLALK